MKNEVKDNHGHVHETEQNYGYDSTNFRIDLNNNAYVLALRRVQRVNERCTPIRNGIEQSQKAREPTLVDLN